jgi:hypothetical protein
LIFLAASFFGVLAVFSLCQQTKSKQPWELGEKLPTRVSARMEKRKKSPDGITTAVELLSSQGKVTYSHAGI